MTNTLTDRLNNAFAGGAAIKSPCRVASTANLTLSSYQTIDGIALGASDATSSANLRVLVKSQTNSSDNGIYVMGSGAWSRAKDFDGRNDIFQGTIVHVSTGASQGGGFYIVTNSDPVIPDTSTAITFSAADVIAATAAASSAAAFAACAYVAASCAYVAAGSAYVAAGSAIANAASAATLASCANVAASSAYVAASCAYVAAGSAITNAASAAAAAASAYVAAGSAYVAAGSAIANAASAATLASCANVAASSAYVAASCAYVAAACAYVAAGCAAAGGTVGPGSTGQIAFYSSAVTPIVRGTSELIYDSAGGITLGASGVTAGALVLASTGGGNTTIKGSTAAIAHTLTLPSSLGSTGQIIQLTTTSGNTGFYGPPVASASTGRVAFYSSTTIVTGSSEFTYNSAGGLTLGASAVTAGSLIFASTGGGNTTVRGSTAAIAYTLALPSSLGSTGQIVQLNTSGGLLGFASVSAGFTLGTEQATTSGTTKDFTGIPAGTKRIVISYVGVSTNGTSNFLVQLGDAGGIETSGYVSTASNNAPAAATSSAGFIVTAEMAATETNSGTVVLDLEDSSDFTWTCIGNLQHQVSTTRVNTSAGHKALSAELTQIRITTVSADTFDAGAVNIKYIS